MTHGQRGQFRHASVTFRVDQHSCPPWTTAGVDAQVPLRRSVMTPPRPHHASGIHRHRLAVRRSAAVLVAALVIGGAPLVARALGDDPVTGAVVRPSRRASCVDRSCRSRPSADLDIAPTSPTTSPAPENEPENEPENQPETLLEAVTRVLTATYTWDERSPRVEELQFLLGIPADGWYAAATLAAHRIAMESAGLPIDLLPVIPPVRPPSSGRRCDSASRTATTRSPTRPGSTAAPTSSTARRGTPSPVATTRRSSESIRRQRHRSTRTRWRWRSTSSAAPGRGRTAVATCADRSRHLDHAGVRRLATSHEPRALTGDASSNWSATARYVASHRSGVTSHTV